MLIIAGVALTITSEKELVEERIEKYMEGTTELEFGSSYDEEDLEKTSALTEWMNERVRGTSFGDRTTQLLQRADMKFKPGEYVALMIMSSVGTGVLMMLVGGKGTFDGIAQGFAIAGLVIGLFLPRIFVIQKQKKRLRDFNGQLPDMLNLMVNGLRAGYSTMQALEAISKELPPPINNEFRRVVQEMQLGIPMETSLDNLLERIPSEDLDLVITAINVQREVGGNLAEVLETISHTIRERIRIKGEVKTLTTQVSYSGKLLALMPVFLLIALWLLNREYVMQFFAEPVWCGASILGCSGIMIIIGWIVMNKIADIEV
ncbi:MAG: type II secretion system F family protein [Chloroflexota bacterium]